MSTSWKPDEDAPCSLLGFLCGNVVCAHHVYVLHFLWKWDTHISCVMVYDWVSFSFCQSPDILFGYYFYIMGKHHIP